MAMQSTAAVRASIAANASRSCLANTSSFFSGISETLNLVDVLSQALNCTHRSGVAPKDRFTVCEDRRKRFPHVDYRELAECKEDLYSLMPFITHCGQMLGQHSGSDQCRAQGHVVIAQPTRARPCRNSNM